MMPLPGRLLAMAAVIVACFVVLDWAADELGRDTARACWFFCFGVFMTWREYGRGGQ